MLGKNLKKLNYQLPLRIVSTLIVGIGLLLIAEVLFAHHPRFVKTANDLFIARLSQDAPLVVGLLFVYLGLLLRRRKRIAWYITSLLFGIYLVIAAVNFSWSDVVLALIGLSVLLIYRKEFVVKSGIYSSWMALRNALIVLLILIIYGIIGFLLLDNSAFGHEIGFFQSLDNTIDAFRIFGQPLKPLTVEGKLFLDSLHVIGFMTYAYILITLFGPIRERYIDHSVRKEAFKELFEKYSKDSEDYFKLWPNDKHYFIYKDAGLAYKTMSGVAIVAGDPVGKSSNFKGLISSFIDECHINDWTVSFVHVSEKYLNLYKKLDLETQKLGEEAIIDLDKFTSTTVNNKHFRNICNRFEKLNYTAELLYPPYSKSVIDALKRVSDSWLSLPGKSERGFMLGYFDKDYLDKCPVLIVRDDAKQIVGFVNQVPTNTLEANVDLMRHLADAAPNVNDYMFVRFLLSMKEQGFKTANLGLCPLAGLVKNDESAVIKNVLMFVYQNGNRFFGFNGLERFKNKFEPEWRSRYIAYQDGVVGFSRAMTILNRALKLKRQKSSKLLMRQS